MNNKPSRITPTNAIAEALAELLANDHRIELAMTRFHRATPILEIHTPYDLRSTAIPRPAALKPFTVRIHTSPQFRPLIYYPTAHEPRTAYTVCQDEPIKLGTQLQPNGVDWVGTAGAPVAWPDGTGGTKYGILSNWHVMHGGRAKAGTPQHQPDDFQPACAHLEAWTAPDQEKPNYIDAAIADAKVDGKHTISNEILDLGQPTRATADAYPLMNVHKVGRTTGKTNAECASVGAAVRVSYGPFTALFVDQDVFEDQNGSFSAPGDSGSLILDAVANAPVALLFAGGGNLTIGNPLRYVTDRFNLEWGF